MRAAVYRRFGGPDVVRVEEVPTPAPGRGEVLVRVHASTVSAADHRARSRDVPRGLRVLASAGIGTFRPSRRVLGMDVAGVVEAVGPGATRFGPGDEVVAMLGGRCGGHAEYAVVPEGGAITRTPRGMTSEEAVTLVFGGITARAFLRQVDLRAGSTVLVTGASGAVGTAVVQLAAHAGARVTAVCRGTHREITDLPGLLRAATRRRSRGKRLVAGPGPWRAEDLAFVVALAEQGRYRAVADRTYDLSEVAEAHRFVDAGRKKGNVVLRIAGGGAPQQDGRSARTGRATSREAAS
ncbi:NAD(P)-dependent alcohol dehydrogenase [Cellulomonas fimi]|uniref:NAD(P)-dependent alcohol dehydrogenase n=1 Tax=Cellulomonas fimi TaxID=1708 RepID=A0A7Y0LZ97_CELFI|nr:NAD(P)-dependent alcohol dehydrogenase [Cellulomonas fimi]NMR20967.1 NAD(P)-dependent alcohol dehydrogenase [Cellulomonas fimi]